MHRLDRYAIFATLLGAVVLDTHAEQITFQNHLSTCMTITAMKTTTESNMVLTKTRIQLHKSIGECGCLSALAIYTSSVNRTGVRQILQEGLISLQNGGEKTLVLATDPALASGKEVGVRLACAGPL